MAKRWRKQKSGQQTAKKRSKIMHGDGDAATASGTFGGLRRFARRVAGTDRKASRAAGSKSTGQRVFDLLLWVAVAAAAYYAVSKQCMR